MVVITGTEDLMLGWSHFGKPLIQVCASSSAFLESDDGNNDLLEFW